MPTRPTLHQQSPIAIAFIHTFVLPYCFFTASAPTAHRLGRRTQARPTAAANKSSDPPQVLTFPADVGDVKKVEEAVAATVARLGRFSNPHFCVRNFFCVPLPNLL